MSKALSALWASIVRTLTPLIVGYVITWVTGLGIAVDEQFGPLLTIVVAGAISGLYYIVVRVLETYVAPRIGWLLGLAKSPTSYAPDSPAKHAA